MTAGGLDLVRRAQDGDEGAFERLYRDHAGRIFALCLRMLGDRTHAEELVQDVFVQAWRRLRPFEGRSAFSTRLHRLAVNVVVMERRAGGGRGRHLALAGSDEVEEPAGRDPPA